MDIEWVVLDDSLLYAWCVEVFNKARNFYYYFGLTPLSLSSKTELRQTER